VDVPCRLESRLSYENIINMSEDSSADTSSCASCGIAQVDDIELKECAECDLVKYCSDECQNYKPQHKEDCKKRAAELHDEILFQQPESSHLGDCPISAAYLYRLI